MQTEMNFEDNEPEISIKAMLFFALHRWKSILLAGIILAVIFGACRLWSANRTAQALEEAINSGAVVLLEERDVTSLKKLTADINQIRLFHKKVLSAIVI